ncbi:unnamed protein product [Linum trigynum]|uniref:Uncharacterized protein n=1 Tax=Linum trigynum TaxID=586398 RepID=A0AAV2EFJ4_9ROSI
MKPKLTHEERIRKHKMLTLKAQRSSAAQRKASGCSLDGFLLLYRSASTLASTTTCVQLDRTRLIIELLR